MRQQPRKLLIIKRLAASIGNSTRPKPFNFGGGFPNTLGERLNGIQEVSGSIPLFSTMKNGTLKRLCFEVPFICWNLRFRFHLTQQKFLEVQY